MYIVLRGARLRHAVLLRPAGEVARNIVKGGGPDHICIYMFIYIYIYVYTHVNIILV